MCRCRRSAWTARMALASFAPTIRSEACSVSGLLMSLFAFPACAIGFGTTRSAIASLSVLCGNRTGVIMCFDCTVGRGLEKAAQNQDMQNKVGKDLSPDEIKACVVVLKEGGAVNLKNTEMELPKAVTVAIVRDGEDVVGVGAIKQQRPPYAKRTESASNRGFSSV